MPGNPPKRRTQQERRIKSEQQIIRAAADLFAEQGYLRTTLNQVGSAAGYTGGLVSHRFGSKEGLLHAVVESMVSRFRENQLASAMTSARGIDALKGVIETYLNEAVLREKRIRALHAIIASTIAAIPEVRSAVLQLNNEIRSHLTELIARCQEEGDVRADINAEHAACAVLGILRGVITQYLSETDSVDLTALSPLVTDMVMKGLK